VKLASDRQLTLDDSVVRYLSTHIERSFAAARAAVISLDKEALRQGRPPTRALAAEMFRDSASPKHLAAISIICHVL
jgi:chromosomal replication initiation ATPase DnaA